MHHLFLGYQMICFIYKLHQSVYVEGPVIENVIGVLLFGEVHDSFQTINLGLYRLIHNKV